MEPRVVEINSIVVEEKIQQRANLNNEYIKDLVVEINNGVKFPPLDVFDIGDKLLLTDGFHRLEAYRQAGIDTVEVNIYKGTERDAILHAVGANATHGLRRTNADKRRAVETLLTDNEWGQWSDTEIARKCLVSQPFVSGIRKELTNNDYEWGSKRKCADGRIMETSNIGAKPPSEESEDSQIIEESGSPQSEAETTNTNENEEPHSSEANDVESSPDSDSDDETEADDESSDQSEEDNIGPDGDDVDGADESTSADNDEEKPIPVSSPEEQAAQEEDEEPEPDSIDPSSEESTEEDDADDNGSHESEADESHTHIIEAPDTDDVQTLKAKIIELKKTIIERDERIAELEHKVAVLKDDVKYYEKEVIESIEASTQEGANVAEKMNYQPLSVY